MKCPRCVQRIHRTAVQCPHCGFELGQADAEFGDSEVLTRCLSDSAGVLKRDERERAEMILERFRDQFPQLFLAVHTGVLTELASLRQFGFWLLNRGAFDDLAVDRPNEGGILLVIDPEAKVAGITYGYRLEPFLDESDTFGVLSAAHPFLLQGQYLKAVAVVERRLGVLLAKRAAQARRDPERFERKVAAPGPPRDLLQRIRARARNEEVEK